VRLTVCPTNRNLTTKNGRNAPILFPLVLFEQIAENLLRIDISLLGQDGHELSYLIAVIIQHRSAAVK